MYYLGWRVETVAQIYSLVEILMISRELIIIEIRSHYESHVQKVPHRNQGARRSPLLKHEFVIITCFFSSFVA